MYTRTSGSFTGREMIRNVIGLNDGRYLTPLIQSRDLIKIWHHENDTQLNYQDIYINTPVEQLNKIEISQEITLSKERRTSNAFVEYLTHFANGFILLKLGAIRGCEHSFLCLFDPERLTATLMKVEYDTSYLPFDREHFVTLLQCEEHYYLFLWNIASRQQVKQIEVTAREFRTIAAVGHHGRLIFNSPDYLYVQPFYNAPISTIAKDKLKTEGILKLGEDRLRREHFSGLMSIDSTRSLLFTSSREIAVLEEREGGLVLTPCTALTERVSEGHIRYKKILSSGGFLLQQSKESPEEGGSHLYIYNLDNRTAPQRVFAVPSAIEHIEDAQQILTMLVVAGRTSERPIVECWNVITGQLVSVDHPVVSLVTPPAEPHPSQSYAGESEVACLSPDEVYPTIMDNGDVVYWQKGKHNFEHFSFNAMRQHVQAHDLAIGRALDSELIMPDVLKRLILDYSIFSPKAKKDETAPVHDVTPALT